MPPSQVAERGAIGEWNPHRSRSGRKGICCLGQRVRNDSNVLRVNDTKKFMSSRERQRSVLKKGNCGPVQCMVFGK